MEVRFAEYYCVGCDDCEGDVWVPIYPFTRDVLPHEFPKQFRLIWSHVHSPRPLYDCDEILVRTCPKQFHGDLPKIESAD